MNFKNLPISKKLAVLVAIPLIGIVILVFSALQIQKSLVKNSDLKENLAVVKGEFLDLIVVQKILADPFTPEEDRVEFRAKVGDIRGRYKAGMEHVVSVLPTLPKEYSETWDVMLKDVSEWKESNDAIFRITQEFEDAGVVDPMGLESDLHQFMVDHFKAIDNIDKFVENGTPYKGTSDPTQCAYGKFVSTHTIKDPKILQSLSVASKEHNHFHEQVGFLKQGKGNIAKHARLADQSGHKMVHHLENADQIAMAYITKLDTINSYADITMDEHIPEVFASLDGMIKRSTEDSIKNSKRSKLGMIIFSLIIIILVITIAYFIVTGISTTLRALIEQVVSVGKEVIKGNTKERAEIESVSDEFQPVLVSMNELVTNIDDSLTESKETLEVVAGLIGAANKGNLDKRAEIGSSVGDNKALKEGINSMLEAIVTPINEAAAVLSQAADKDLKGRVTGNYQGKFAELKDNINSALSNLDVSLQQVSQGSAQVGSASQQIASGSQTLAQGSNEQASSLEEISSSLEEISSMTKQNAENSKQAQTLSGEANGNAATGSAAMNRMNAAMTKIKESSNETSKIIKTIDEIAMQTNLLALNAAVEAARAGEAGRGFAVVADEVRNLAQRSATAAKNTADMIQESVENAENGAKIAEEVATSLTAIEEGSEKVNNLIAEVAAASGEQSRGITQVNEAVSQMDKITQDNASSSEESASASEELSSLAEELMSMVGQFSLSVEASNNLGGAQAPLIGNSSPQRRKVSAAPKMIGSNGGNEVSPEEVISFDDHDDLEDF
jgi:methyl-accepting chemotaxis protein